MAHPCPYILGLIPTSDAILEDQAGKENLPVAARPLLLSRLIAVVVLGWVGSFSLPAPLGQHWELQVSWDLLGGGEWGSGV